jgi:hypothetical protein
MAKDHVEDEALEGAVDELGAVVELGHEHLLVPERHWHRGMLPVGAGGAALLLLDEGLPPVLVRHPNRDNLPQAVGGAAPLLHPRIRFSREIQ